MLTWRRVVILKLHSIGAKIKVAKGIFLQLLLEKTSASDMNRYYTCYVTWLSAPQRKLNVLLIALT